MVVSEMQSWNKSIYNHVWDFEKNFDVRVPTRWMEENWQVSFVYALIYLTLIFGGKTLMLKRSPMEVRGALMFWNLAFAIFSYVGAVRTVPELLFVLRESGFHHSVCDNSFLNVNKVTRFWAWMFTVSKIYEFGDTIFIILKKQKLIFLHWTHHLLTFLYCWYTYKDHNSTGRWFVCMNFSIHAVMYTYYALRAMRLRVPRFASMLITTAQLMQMIVGCYVSIYAYRAVVRDEKSCQLTMNTAKLSLLMYIFYLFMFGNLFYTSYFASRQKKCN